MLHVVFSKEGNFAQFPSDVGEETKITGNSGILANVRLSLEIVKKFMIFLPNRRVVVVEGETPARRQLNLFIWKQNFTEVSPTLKKQ